MSICRVKPWQTLIGLSHLPTPPPGIVFQHLPTAVLGIVYHRPVDFLKHIWLFPTP